MAKKFFSDIPILSIVLEKSGLISRAWSLWFRDLYNQVNKNAIDIEELIASGGETTTGEVASPVVSVVTGNATVSTLRPMYWKRSGDIVDLFGTFELNATDTNEIGLYIDVPIIANMANGYFCTGTSFLDNQVKQLFAGGLNRFYVAHDGVTSIGTNDLHYQASYKITP